MPSTQTNRNDYISRINRVMDYIEANIASSLTLEELSRVAHFSPFHFHRTFSSIVGETLYQFINRLRLERAASHLLTNPSKPITSVAIDNGFSGSATFARAFQSRYGMSASQWRKGGHLQFSKNGKTNSKNGKDPKMDFGYINHHASQASVGLEMETISQRSIPMPLPSNLQTKVRVESLPQTTVAYVRHVGPYKGDSQLFQNLWGRLMKWAGPRGLLQNPDMKCLCVYHDSPELTVESKLRTSVCISVPDETLVQGEIGKMKIAGGKYACGHFEIDVAQFEEAWKFMYGSWLPESGYQPEDQPSFEWCLNNPDDHPEKKHIIDICIPVKPL